MPRDNDDDARDAQELELDEDAADESQSPAASGDESDDDPSPSESDVERPARLSKKERDRRAREGRVRRQQADTINRLAGQVDHLSAQLGSLVSGLTAEERARQEQQDRQREAYLKTLPPDQQALKRVEYLEQRIAGLQAQPKQPSTSTPQPRPSASPAARREETSEEYQRRRMGEILDEIEEEYGITLTGKERGLDASGEDVFIASARAIAAQLADNEEEPVAKKASARGRPPEDEDDTDDLEERVDRQARRDLGVGRPNSPRSAAPPRSGPITPEHFRAVTDKYNSKKGPRGPLKEIAKLRDRAAARIR